jgi:antitoxin Phd
MLDACITDGPQLVTRRGVDAAVLVQIESWQQLQPDRQFTLKRLLLAKSARFDAVLPSKGKARRRARAPTTAP